MSALPVGPLTRDTLEDRVYAQIRDALMEGRFAAGQPITLRALAQALGVSLTSTASGCGPAPSCRS